MTAKEDFASKLVLLASTLKPCVSSGDGQWTVKGFIDIFKNVYTLYSGFAIGNTRPSLRRLGTGRRDLSKRWSNTACNGHCT
jgi:hypothetical protein